MVARIAAGTLEASFLPVSSAVGGLLSGLAYQHYGPQGVDNPDTMWVIFAVLAGGQLFGFLGVLLALPAAAALNVMVRHLHGHYRESAIYTRAPAAGKPPPPSAPPGDGEET